jgi:rhodanese-related sulfurtransferase
MSYYRLPVCLFFLFASGALLAQESPALAEIQDYLDFATYGDGTISVEQLEDAGSEILFIDSRSADQFEQGHIAGALNIEWRDILKRKDEVPRDRTVVFYCNTGTLSAKAQFILRLSGYDNAKVLHGGYEAWKANQGDQPIQ